MITVGILLYGDFPDLARQVLSSVLQQRWVQDFSDVRIGCNEISPSTQDVLTALLSEWSSWGGAADVWMSDANSFKYPLMRRMLHEQPLTNEYFMWWDDDSRMLSTAPDDWPSLVVSYLSRYHLIGLPYHPRPPLTQEQIANLNRKPWYTGKPTPPLLKFITGGWWSIRSEILIKHDWPPEDMLHNGGDIALSHLCLQQGYEIGTFKEHLAINADATGRPSSAKRRGVEQFQYFHSRAGELKSLHAQHR